MTDGSGNWVADFSGMIDLEPGMDGASAQYDSDYDQTYAFWWIPNPYFEVVPKPDWIHGWEWPEGETVHVCVDDTAFADDPTDPGQCNLYHDSTTVEIPSWNPNTTVANFWLQGTFDLQAGQYISMTDEVTLKEHLVTNLEVTDTDLDADTVSGTADPGTDVWVWPFDCWNCGVTLAANGSGDWVADFSGSFDIVAGTEGEASQVDADEDETRVDWRSSDPTVLVTPEEDIIEGGDFELGVPVTVIIDDDANAGNGYLYSTDREAEPAEDLPWATLVQFFLQDLYDVQPGQYVTIDDGTNSETTLVTSLSITNVDEGTDIITGSGDSSDDVWVTAFDCWECGIMVAPDPSYDWTADLSSSYDILTGSDGIAQQADSNGNITQVIWRKQVPGWVQENLNGFWVPQTRSVSSLNSVGGELYASGGNSWSGTNLWQKTNSFKELMRGGFGDYHNQIIDDIVEFAGQLYASTYNEAGGEIWRSSDGVNWTQVVSGGFTNPSYAEISNLIVFGGQIYAGSWTDGSIPAGIWRSDTGALSDWVSVVSDGLGNPGNSAIVAFEVFGGDLYAGVGDTTSGGAVWRSASGDSGTWTIVSSPGFGDANNVYIADLAGYQSYLYAITHHDDGAGAEIWRCQTCDGTDWVLMIDNGFGDADRRRMPALEMVGDRLYAVLGRYTGGLEVWRTLDGTNWHPISLQGFGDANNLASYFGYSVAGHEDHLYVGTVNYETGGELWRRLNYGVSIDPVIESKPGQPGGTIIYSLLVTNEGESADTFNVVITGNIWTTTANATVGPLAPGGATMVDVTVTIPPGASYGDTDVATLTLTSQGDSVESAEATLTSEVAHMIFLPLIMR